MCWTEVSSFIDTSAMAMMRSTGENILAVKAIITKSIKLENADWSTGCTEAIHETIKASAPKFLRQRRQLPEDRPAGDRVGWSNVELEVTISLASSVPAGSLV